MMMVAALAVNLKNVNKQYRLNLTKQSLIGCFLRLFRSPDSINQKKYIQALKNIELKIKTGECIGIIGENASGKTTLLRIINQITVPSSGELQIRGKVAGLLDLGAGFHAELTGKENVYLDAALSGMRQKEIDAVYDRIVGFSGLADFINLPVKTYSQGMLVRLGFAIAIHLDPDVFLIDDSLSVGDEEFQRKCLAKIMELKEKGKTIIVVSHDLDSISRICERGILLKSGRILKDDSMHKVILRYVEAVGDKNSIVALDKGKISIIFNNGKIVILWDGNPVTKNFGGYVSFQILNKWFMSWQAKWRVIENHEDYWKVKGEFKKNGVGLEMACFMEDEHSIKFIFNLRVPKLLELRKIGVGFMVSEQYGNYLKDNYIECIEKIDDFSKEWTDIYRTDESNASLLLIDSDRLPALKVNFEPMQYPSFKLVQNTTRELSARIVQTQIGLPQDRGSSGQDDDFMIDCNCRMEFLNEASLRGFIQQNQQNNQIELNGLKVQLQDKGMQVFYRNEKLTDNAGITMGFYHKNKFYNFFDGKWSVDKKTAQSLKLCAQFSKIGLEAILRLSLMDNILQWDVALDTDKNINNSRIILSFFGTRNYEKYFSERKEFDFLPSGEYAEKIDLSFSATTFAGLMGKEERLPLLVLECCPECKCELQNAAIDFPGRIFRQEKDGCNLTGKLRVFDTEEQKNIFLIKNRQKKESEKFLTNGSLRLEVDNNRIDIYCNNVKISAGEGFCSGIYYNGRWYESTQLKKQIMKTGNVLAVLIERQLPQVTENWEICFEDDKINWTIKIKCAEKLDEIYYKSGIVLSSEYECWAHSFSSGEMPQGEKNDLIIDLDDQNNSLLGVNSLDCFSPAVFFEKKNNASGIIIQKVENKVHLFFKLKDTQINKFIKSNKIFSAQISLSDQKLWQAKLIKHRQEDFSLTANNGLQLFAANQCIKLLFRGEELTQAKGLAVALLSEAGDIDTHYPSWRFKKKNSRQIDVFLDWGSNVISEKWEFELIEQAIQWSVFLDIKKPVLVKELLVNMFSRKNFRRWQTTQESGFIDCKDIAGKSVTMFDNRSKILRIFESETGKNIPGLEIETLVDMSKWFLHIYNHERGDGIACGLHYLSDLQGDDFEPGINEIFKAKISLLDLAQDVKKLVIKDTRDSFLLKKGKLKIVIEKAGIRLFWGERELTLKLGLFSAFLLNNKWVDSKVAKWNVEKKKDSVKISLSWASYFMRQSWELRILNEHELLWNIETEIDWTGVSAHAVGVMISPEYKYYKFLDKPKAAFPDKFKKDTWINMGKGKKQIEVQAMQDCYPRISFYGSARRQQYFNLVDNTDLLHAARVLKCQTDIAANKNTEKSKIFTEVKIQVKE